MRTILSLNSDYKYLYLNYLSSAIITRLLKVDALKYSSHTDDSYNFHCKDNRTTSKNILSSYLEPGVIYVLDDGFSNCDLLHVKNSLVSGVKFKRDGVDNYVNASEFRKELKSLVKN